MYLTCKIGKNQFYMKIKKGYQISQGKGFNLGGLLESIWRLVKNVQNFSISNNFVY